MKKIITFFGIILALLIINLFSINAFYNNFSGEKLYENKYFSGALEKFSKNKDYIGLYNLGNVYYRLGEKEKDLDKKVNYWEKSLDYYKNSLKIKYSKNTEFNYNFVLDKLKKLKKKQEEEKKKQEQKSKQQQDQDNKQKSGKQENDKKDSKREKGKKGENQKDGKSGEKQKNGENSKSGKKSDKQNGKQGNSKSQDDKNGKNGEQQKTGKSGEKGEKSDKAAGQQGGTQDSPLQKPQLSESAKQKLKAYEEQLKQEQQQNAGNYGKVYREQTNPFDAFDSFFGNDPFFDNSLLNSGGDKKDW